MDEAQSERPMQQDAEDGKPEVAEDGKPEVELKQLDAEDGKPVQNQDVRLEENEENSEMKTFEFNPDVGNFYVQILSKGEKIPKRVRVYFSLFLLLLIVLQTVLYMSLNNYLGIGFAGWISRNSADGAKDMAPKCLKEYIKEYKDCVGTKQVFHGEDEYMDTQAYKTFVANSANEQKCQKKKKMNELCMMEVNQTYGGEVGILRWVLMILCIFIAKTDFDSLNQSVFLFKQISEENSPGMYHTVQFSMYCIFRVFFIYWGLLIMFELTTNAVYFQTPMDICMNFAALAFLLEIDDLLVAQNWFVVLKSEYNLFEDDEYPLSELKEMGSIRQVFFPKSMKKSKNCCGSCHLTWIVIVLAFVLIFPVRMVGNYFDFKAHGGEYWMAKFGAWFDEDWFVAAQKEPEYLKWVQCSDTGEEPDPWKCMETHTKVKQWQQTGLTN